MTEFETFFRSQADPVWNFLLRLLRDRERASDCFQRVFLKAYTRFGSRRTAGSERAWVFTIAVNEARDEGRRRRRDRLRPAETPDGRAAAESDPSEAAADRELAREVLGALDELPERQREIFLLVRYRGLTFPEAAAACGMGVSAAKQAVGRALEKVRAVLRRRIDLRSLQP